MAALTHCLAYHPQVTHCVVCTDNDEAGELFAAKVAGIPGITTARAPPPVGKDWNDALLAIQKAERQQSRLRSGLERG
jgi:DNA primase